MLDLARAARGGPGRPLTAPQERCCPLAMLAARRPVKFSEGAGHMDGHEVHYIWSTSIRKDRRSRMPGPELLPDHPPSVKFDGKGARLLLSLGGTIARQWTTPTRQPASAS